MSNIRFRYNPHLIENEDIVKAIKEFSEKADIEIDLVPDVNCPYARYVVSNDVSQEVYERVWHGVDQHLLEVYKRYK